MQDTMDFDSFVHEGKLKVTVIKDADLRVTDAVAEDAAHGGAAVYLLHPQLPDAKFSLLTSWTPVRRHRSSHQSYSSRIVAEINLQLCINLDKLEQHVVGTALGGLRGVRVLYAVIGESNDVLLSVHTGKTIGNHQDAVVPDEAVVLYSAADACAAIAGNNENLRRCLKMGHRMPLLRTIRAGVSSATSRTLGMNCNNKELHKWISAADFEHKLRTTGVSVCGAFCGAVCVICCAAQNFVVTLCNF